MNLITKIIRAFSKRSRESRSAIFRQTFFLDANTKILDLGSETGLNIYLVIHGTSINPKNVYIADINSTAVNKGSKQFGFNPVIIDESKKLPFSDGFFDIVYCSSVIEHVTVPKEQVWKLYSGKAFENESIRHQIEFANEIKRIGMQYFVQTPYKHFPIESHSWLPFLSWFPRWLLILVLRLTNLFWVKKTSPDWNLLDKAKLSQLFSDAQIVEEKAFGLTKSIMAIKAYPYHKL